jgi:DNA-directed RNA polymerase subunit K/omega
MKTMIQSRGPSIDRELLVEKSGNNMYNLIIAGAIRAREIRRQHKTSERFEHLHPIVTTMLEIQEGKIDPIEYLKRVK